MNTPKIAAMLAGMVVGPMVYGAAMDSQKLTAVPFTEVKIEDQFWSPRIKTNREKTIPHDFKMCEETGRIDNFAKAGGLMAGEFRGIFYDDSDLYKAIEGAAYSLATHPDAELDKYLDMIIAKIAAAQQKNGYLYTYYTLKEPEKKFTDLKSHHELYCAGHLMEAAVAHHRATGKRTFLDVAIKLADHIDSAFGPGKLQDPDGHEEIELALVKLYNLTHEERYLKLARFFIDQRGRPEKRKLWGLYFQDHKPLTEQQEAVGHAVRAMYFFCGAADVATATGDVSYITALDRLWENLVQKKMYITGGIGARHGGESFGDNYELPNEAAYAETCAAVGNALWNHRMNLLHADAKYADTLERVLYNGFLSGVSLSGDKFFYVNPLASRGKHHRQAWYGTACCPSNVVRFLPSVPEYLYATGKDAIYVNLYAAGTATVSLGEQKVKITQETKYPWEGKVKLTIESPKDVQFDLYLRVPGWVKGQYGATMSIDNGRGVPPKVEVDKGYLKLAHVHGEQSRVDFGFNMDVQRVAADPNVKADVGRVALQRGPIVYCLEACDNGGRVFNLSLPKDSELKTEYRADLLGGVMVVKGKALAWQAGNAPPKEVELTAVPYYAWDNREPGEMIVWLPVESKLAEAPEAGK
jgi:hypothetical protein